MHAFDFILVLFLVRLRGGGDTRASGEALSCSLFAEGSRQGQFFGFAFFTTEFLAPFFALLFESPAAPSPALRPLPMSALAAR
jgi:hypothetical protein